MTTPSHRAPGRWSQTAIKARLMSYNERLEEEAIRANERERIARFLSRVAEERDPRGPAPEIQELIAGVLETTAALIRAGLNPGAATRRSDG